jgi:hypothetical protein
MKEIFKCRRSSLAIISIIMLGGLMGYQGTDFSMAIASIVGLVGASNSFEKAAKAKAAAKTIEKE